MIFFIATPSFNQTPFLRRCIASVRDQADSLGTAVDRCSMEADKENPATRQLGNSTTKHAISVHHHVQDGGSEDGTSEFLEKPCAEDGKQTADDGFNDFNAFNVSTTAGSYQLTFASEADNGMYDAINRGIELMFNDVEGGRLEVEGESHTTSNIPHSTSYDLHHDSVVAWLNCDEQYLPGTLGFVGEYFRRHPEVDILFGDYLVVDQDGELLSFRKGYAPRLAYIQTAHLYTLSCTMFFRARVFEAMGGFDTKYKAIADEDFVVRALKAGFKAKHVRRYFSTFTFTGDNLGGSRVAEEEYGILKQETPSLLKLLRVPVNVARWIEKFSSGAYFQRFPLEYSIYEGEGFVRKTFTSSGAGWKWPA